MSLRAACCGFVLQILAMTVVVSPALAKEAAPEGPKFGGPAVGEEAPALSLRDTLGREVELASLWKKTPLVLVTGSHSCPVYRVRAAGLQRLFERYGARVGFAVLYTVEAHPAGSASPYSAEEWLTDENKKDNILLTQPATFEERARLASQSRTALGLEMPVLVDGMDNAGWEEYGNAPNACYLINSEGEVRLRQDWFDPPALEKDVLIALQEEPATW